MQKTEKPSLKRITMYSKVNAIEELNLNVICTSHMDFFKVARDNVNLVSSFSSCHNLLLDKQGTSQQSKLGEL